MVLAYLAGMLAIGWWVARRVRSFADFFVAGGRMTTPVLVCTLVSTYYGLDVTFGASETAFHEGLAAFWVYSAPFYLAYAGMALLVAPRLRRLPVRSLPEAMALHYGRSAGLATALASFVYSAPIVGVAGMGLIGELVLGWDPLLATCAGAGVALAYTLLGGLWADVLTDTVQFTVMCVSVALAAALALGESGGHAELAQRLGAWATAPLGELGWDEVLVYASIAVTPLVEPAFYQRIFAARGTLDVRRALLIGLVLWAAYDWLVVYLGLAGRDLAERGLLPAQADASVILLHMAARLLPAGLLGLFVAGLLAAAMSTIDSYTLIAAGNLVYDGWQPLARRKLGDAGLLRATRVAAAATLGLCVVLALRFERLRDAWIFMATVLLATALLPMAAALFLRRPPPPRAGAWGAWTGLATALALFAAVEALGVPDPVAETRVLDLSPLLGEGAALAREQAVLVAAPASWLAFAAGALAPRGRA